MKGWLRGAGGGVPGREATDIARKSLLKHNPSCYELFMASTGDAIHPTSLRRLSWAATGRARELAT